MDLYVIRRHGAWANQDELAQTAQVSAQVGEEMADQVRWIRSYAVDEPDGRVGSVCIYEATGLDAIREHGRRIGADSDDIRPVAGTAIIRDDPVSAH